MPRTIKGRWRSLYPVLRHLTTMQTSWRHDIVVIGGSAGAIDGIRKLLDSLSPGFPATIFVTLHIPSDFPSILPELLNKSKTWTVRHPQNHEKFKPGEVLIAPPDYHLIVEHSRIVLSRGPRENRHRPAIDVMFRSAARAYGPRVVGVVLSGQLDDGSAGLMAVKMKGGMAVVQAPKEAPVPEMPDRAIQYADPDHILPIAEIAQLLTSVCSEELPLPKAVEVAVPDNNIEIETKEANLEDTPAKEIPGKPSVFACPDCHGVLWELEDGKLLRFRCRVGHAYTADSLRLALSESTEAALWVAMRTLEERATILRRLADRTAGRMATQYEESASGFDQHAQTIRRILLENQQITESEPPRNNAGQSSPHTST